MLNSAYMLQQQWKNLSAVRFLAPDTDLFESETARGNVHMPTIRFEYNEPKPHKYETRDCYPIQSEEVKRALKERLDRLTLTTSLTKSSSQVCLVYNDVMLKHRNVPEP